VFTRCDTHCSEDVNVVDRSLLDALLGSLFNYLEFCAAALPADEDPEGLIEQGAVAVRGNRGNDENGRWWRRPNWCRQRRKDGNACDNACWRARNARSKSMREGG
jgi:hypothetical protein